MKLTVLVDNNVLNNGYYLGEPGLSFLIEDNNDGKKTKVLFDTGYSDVFLKNAQSMRLSLLDLDYIAISHGHYDHTWGLDYLIRHYTEAKVEKAPHKTPTIVAHPLTFRTKRYKEFNEVGSIISAEKLNHHFPVRFSKEPVWLTDSLVFLGEVDRGNWPSSPAFNGKLVTDVTGEVETDQLLEDSALVYRSSKGLVVITGCSHSGICNIVEAARKVCDEDRIHDIIGGFHLQSPSPELLRQTLDYMKDVKPDVIHACHCTDLASKIALAGVGNVKEVGVGLRLEY